MLRHVSSYLSRLGQVRPGYVALGQFRTVNSCYFMLVKVSIDKDSLYKVRPG